ncbi:MAG: FtsX-like permease family protein [Clostridia bacterium]|nr:FtsX-like permease family protein [Clostridia bacterium]
MVTHSEKVASICSRVVEIADGKIIKDEKKENYQKEEKEHKLVEEITSQPLKSKKEGHLSFLSAFKLSIHNMWAGKVKNILMAIGVSIALVSMILMLSFGSGLTNYISDMSKAYANPNIVTISKSSPKDMQFSPDEIDSITTELNSFLATEATDFQIIKEGAGKNISYGFTLVSMGAAGGIEYTKDDGSVVNAPIMVTDTTPPYYTDKNLAAGKICGENEIMLSRNICETLEVDDPEQAVGTKVRLKAFVAGITIDEEVTISGIVDNSIMLALYVDYDYLDSCVRKEQEKDPSLEVTGLKPTSFHITTNDEAITGLIKDYLQENREDLSGSVEEQLTSMFGELMSTFSIALAVISGISLFVALIMIMVVLYMSVSERTKEIGVLKSIGARRKDIRLIFSSESFLVGLFSGLVSIIISLIAGGIFTLLFNALLGFAPICMEIQYFAIALLLSIIISVLAGLYPSSKAAKLDPVESLRRE